MSKAKEIEGFNRLSRNYQLLSSITFGSTILKSQFHYLSSVPTPTSILVIGGGTGELLVELMEQYPNSQIDWCDYSIEMINKAKGKLSSNNSHQVNFINEDILNFENLKQYELICSMFVLDCFIEDDLEILIKRLKIFSNKATYIIITDFNIPQKLIPKIIAKLVVSFLYLVFNRFYHLRNQTLMDYEKEFKKYGFKSLESKSFINGIIKSTIYSLDHKKTPHLKR